MLYLVATPIGNLKDITLRAIEILKNVDYILCEDTRITGKLLNTYQIDKKMISFNDFNEESRILETIGNLLSNQNIALVSDAGTPLIADPGFKLVREAIKQGINIESVPGPSAAIGALTISGLAPDKFIFLGYLPKKQGKRKEILKNIQSTLKGFKTTVIFYESPYRLLKSLADILELFGDIDMVVCRELTKLHQEIRRETVTQSIDHFTKTPPKGEFTILI